MSVLNKTKSNTLYFLKNCVQMDTFFIKEKKQHKKLTQNCFLKKKKGGEQKQKPTKINEKIKENKLTHQ